MPFRPRAAVSGAILASAAVLLSPAAAAARPAPPGWSAAPAPGDGAPPGPQDRPYFYLEGAPGTVLTDRLSLANPSGRAVTVRLRTTGSGLGAWLALAAKEVRIPPRTRAGVPFTVTVPRTAAPGSRSGAILATGDGGGRGTRERVPVHLRVTGPELSALTVEDISVDDAPGGEGGAAVIRYALVNRGNTALRPRVALRAEGIFGPALRRAARTLPQELRPGQRIHRTEKWPDPPAADSVRIRVTATAEGGARGSATATYTAVPWAGIAGAAAVLAAGAWALLRRRGRADAARRTAVAAQASGERQPAAAGRELARTGTATGSGPVPGSGART